MSVERKRVEKSSNVWSHGFDETNQEVHVEYGKMDPFTKQLGPSGKVYVHPCTAEEYKVLTEADSVGGHLAKNFKSRLTRVREKESK